MYLTTTLTFFQIYFLFVCARIIFQETCIQVEILDLILILYTKLLCEYMDVCVDFFIKCKTFFFFLKVSATRGKDRRSVKFCPITRVLFHPCPRTKEPVAEYQSLFTTSGTLNLDSSIETANMKTQHSYSSLLLSDNDKIDHKIVY